MAARGSSGRVCWRFNVSGIGGGRVILSGSVNGDSIVCRSVGGSGSVSGSSISSGRNKLLVNRSIGHLVQDVVFPCIVWYVFSNVCRYVCVCFFD